MRSCHLLKAKNRSLALGERTVIMGILNVTPDSFSDGGQYFGTEAAVKQADALHRAGADVIDIGGESTRPGSTPVSAETELARILPVIEALQSADVLISVDTWKSEVADRVLTAGAHLINDITALQGDPAMAEVIRAHGAGVCLMHNAVLYRGGDAPGAFPLFGQDNRRKMAALQSLPVTEALERFFDLILTDASAAGISADHMLLDPGFGFGVSAEENKQLFNHLPTMLERPFPWLVALSRKRFVSALSGDDLSPDLTTAVLGQSAVFAGAHMLRVHDVALQRRYADLADDVLAAG